MAAIIYKPEDEEYAYTASGAVAVNTVLFDVDTAQLPPNVDLLLHVGTLGTGGIITCYSNNFDGGMHKRAVPVEPLDSSAGVLQATINAAGLFTIPTAGRFVQVVLTTGITAGSTALKVYPRRHVAA